MHLAAPGLDVLGRDALRRQQLLAGERHHRAALVERHADRLLVATDLLEALEVRALAREHLHRRERVDHGNGADVRDRLLERLASGECAPRELRVRDAELDPALRHQQDVRLLASRFVGERGVRVLAAQRLADGVPGDAPGAADGTAGKRDLHRRVGLGVGEHCRDGGREGEGGGEDRALHRGFLGAGGKTWASGRRARIPWGIGRCRVGGISGRRCRVQRRRRRPRGRRRRWRGSCRARRRGEPRRRPGRRGRRPQPCRPGHRLAGRSR